MSSWLTQLKAKAGASLQEVVQQTNERVTRTTQPNDLTHFLQDLMSVPKTTPPPPPAIKIPWERLIDPVVSPLIPVTPNVAQDSSLGVLISDPSHPTSPQEIRELLTDNMTLYEEGVQMKSRIVQLERRLNDKMEQREDLETKLRDVKSENAALKSQIQELEAMSTGDAIRTEVARITAHHKKETQLLENALESSRANVDRWNDSMEMADELHRARRRIADLEYELSQKELDVVDPNPDTNDYHYEAFWHSNEIDDSNIENAINGHDEEINGLRDEIGHIRAELAAALADVERLKNVAIELDIRSIAAADEAQTKIESLLSERELLQHELQELKGILVAGKTITTTPHTPPMIEPPTALSSPKVGVSNVTPRVGDNVCHVPRTNMLLRMKSTGGDLTPNEASELTSLRTKIQELSTTVETERQEWCLKKAQLSEQLAGSQRMANYLHELLLDKQSQG